jgi:glycosyltransferase involved in cell wall biosynthesis
MNVLFFAGGSYVGGMESVTLTLMKSLVAAGHSAAAIVSGWNDGVYPRQLKESRIPFRCIKLGRFYRSKPLWTLDGLLNLPRAARELKSFVRDFAPDVIVYPDIGLAFIALQLLDRNILNVFHLHDNPGVTFNSFMGKTVMSRCSGCIVVSNFAAEQFVSKSGQQTKVRAVHNGVAVPKAPPQPTPSKLVRIGIIGQLIPRKRHQVLIDSVAMLEERLRQKIEIRIYGPHSNEYASEIRKRIGERSLEKMFTWMGFVESRDQIYSNLDIVVAAAVDEPFGLTILEAGAYAIAVIASRSGGFPETVVDNRTGLLVSPDSASELACAIQHLVENPTLRAQMGLNGRAHVTSTFCPEKMALNFLSALQEFGIADRRSGGDVLKTIR